MNWSKVFYSQINPCSNEIYYLVSITTRWLITEPHKPKKPNDNIWLPFLSKAIFCAASTLTPNVTLSSVLAIFLDFIKALLR